MRKLFVAFLILVLVFVSAPTLVYKFSLSRLDEMPRQSDIKISEAAVLEIWASNETCTVQDCLSVTPYWLYKWFGIIILNELDRQEKLKVPKNKLSIMALAIARDHMAEIGYEFGFNDWKFFLSANLAVWLQTNWSAQEIVEKYEENAAI